MSRNTPRRRVRMDELAEELAIGAALRLRTDSDAIRLVIDAVVAYLAEEYPTQDFYIPAPLRYSAQAVRTDLLAGKSIRYVCRTHRISRATAYLLLDPIA